MNNSELVMGHHKIKHLGGTLVCLLMYTVCVYFHGCFHVAWYVLCFMTNRSLLCPNRSSMSCTVKWAPPSSFVRSVLRTTKTSRSNPAVTLCALPVLQPGRYRNEPYCINWFWDQNSEQRGTAVALDDCCVHGTWWINARIFIFMSHFCLD